MARLAGVLQWRLGLQRQLAGGAMWQWRWRGDEVEGRGAEVDAVHWRWSADASSRTEAGRCLDGGRCVVACGGYWLPVWLRGGRRRGDADARRPVSYRGRFTVDVVVEEALVEEVLGAGGRIGGGRSGCCNEDGEEARGAFGKRSSAGRKD